MTDFITNNEVFIRTKYQPSHTIKNYLWYFFIKHNCVARKPLQFTYDNFVNILKYRIVQGMQIQLYSLDFVE